MNDIVLKTEMPDIGLPRRGKVRDIYDTGRHLLLIATDRVSAFDVVLPNGIPGKGRVLTQISVLWFSRMREIIDNHLVSADVDDYPEALIKYRNILEGRSMLVKKAKPVPVECIVRGYLSGSGWKEYRNTGTVCGIKLAKGLKESSRLDEPIFTPSTKAEEGHDLNISFDEMADITGLDLARKLRDVSFGIYKRASEIAEKKGIIIADTKMEFGIHEEKLILIDELLTPDSSRFWSAKTYKPGRSQDSYDKQIIRDHLLTLKWNHMPPAPELPSGIILKTAERYSEILKILATEK